MSDYSDLLDTLYEIDKKDGGAELLNTLNIIANLMFDLYKDRSTGAVYMRTIRIGKQRELQVEIKYNVKAK